MIVGSNGKDILTGGQQKDIMFAGEGNDVLNGGGGDDRLYGGDGADVLEGGDGSDWLDGCRNTNQAQALIQAFGVFLSGHLRKFDKNIQTATMACNASTRKQPCLNPLTPIAAFS